MGRAKTAVWPRTPKGLRFNSYILESFWYLQWRLHNWGDPRTYQSVRQARSAVRCCNCPNLLPWALQACRSRSYRYVRTLNRRPWGISFGQRPYVRSYLLLAHPITKTRGLTSAKIAWLKLKQHAGYLLQRLDLYQCLKRRALIKSTLVFRPCYRDRRAKRAQVSWCNARPC